MKTVAKFITILIVLISFLKSSPAYAASSTGTATLTLSPGTSTLTTGAKTINLQLNTGTASTNGIQIVADFTGTVPVDLLFTPIPPAGFSASYNQLITITNGKRLQVIIDTGSTTGYSTSGAQVSIGTLTFTAPTSGAMTVTFDQVQTAVLDSNYVDFLHTVTNAVYTFAPVSNPTPTPTPTSTPRPTPTVTPVPSPSPSPDTAQINLTLKFEGVAEVPRTDPALVNLTLVNTQSGTHLTKDAVVMLNRNDGTGTYTNNSTISFSNFQNGTYNVFVKGPVHLIKIFSNKSITAGVVTLDLAAEGQLKTADTNGDNAINTIDYAKMISSFGCRKNPLREPVGKDCTSYTADVDIDGDVDIYDYAYLVGNYNQVGDQIP